MPSTGPGGMRAGRPPFTEEEGRRWLDRRFPVPPLTDDQRGYLRYYRSFGSTTINQGLGQNPEKLTPSMLTAIGNIDAVMDQSALPESVVLFHGANADLASRMGASVNDTASMQNLVGTVHTEAGYMSTSVVPHPDYTSRRIYVMFRGPAGYPALNAEKAVRNGQDEMEVLTKRAPTFIVHAVTQRPDPYGMKSWFIEAEFVPDGWERPPGWAPSPYGAQMDIDGRLLLPANGNGPRVNMALTEPASNGRSGGVSPGPEGSGRGPGGRTVDEARADVARAQAEVVRFETDLETTRTTFALADDDPSYLGGKVEAAQRRVTAAEAEIDLAQARIDDSRDGDTSPQIARSEMDRARTELDRAQSDLDQARDNLTERQRPATSLVEDPLSRRTTPAAEDSDDSDSDVDMASDSDDAMDVEPSDDPFDNADLSPLLDGLDDLDRDDAAEMLRIYYDHHVNGTSLDSVFHSDADMEEQYLNYTRYWRETGALLEALNNLGDEGVAPPRGGWDSIVDPARRTAVLPEQTAERFGSRPGQTRDFAVPTDNGAVLPARIIQREELLGSTHPRFEWNRIPRTTPDGRDTVEAVVRLERVQAFAGPRPDVLVRAENELVRTMEAQINNGRTVTHRDGTTEQIPYTLRNGAELRLRVELVDRGQADRYTLHGHLGWGRPFRAGTGPQPNHATAVPDVLSWFGLTESAESQAARLGTQDAPPARVTAASLSRISALTAESTSAPAPVYEGLVPREHWKDAREHVPVTTIGSPNDSSGVAPQRGAEAKYTAVPARLAAAGDPDGRTVPGAPDGAPELVLPPRLHRYNVLGHFEVRRVPIPEQFREPGGPTHVREFTTRIRFDSNGIDPDVIARRMRAYQTTLDAALNYQHRLPNDDGSPGDQLHVTVENADDPDVTGPVHRRVTWVPTVDGEIPRSNASRWAVDADPISLVHETLHMFGLVDEYHQSDTPGVFRTRPDLSRVDTAPANIMSWSNHAFARLREHHLDELAAISRPALDRGNGGPTPYETPVRIADLTEEAGARIGTPLQRSAPDILDTTEQALDFLAAYLDHQRGDSVEQVTDNLGHYTHTADDGSTRPSTSAEKWQMLEEAWDAWRADGALDRALAELAALNAPSAPTSSEPAAPRSTDASQLSAASRMDTSDGEDPLSRRIAPAAEESDSSESDVDMDSDSDDASQDSDASTVIAGSDGLTREEARTFLRAYYDHHVRGRSLDAVFQNDPDTEEEFRDVTTYWRESGALLDALYDLGDAGYRPPPGGWESIVNPTRRTVPLPETMAAKFGNSPGQSQDLSVTTDDGTVLPARITQRRPHPGVDAPPRFEWNRITRDGRDLVEVVVRLDRGRPPAGADPRTVAQAEQRLVADLESQVNDGRLVPRNDGTQERIPYTLRDGSELRLKVKLVTPGQAPDPFVLHGHLRWGAPVATPGQAPPDHSVAGPDILAWFGLTESTESQAVRAHDRARRVENRAAEDEGRAVDAEAHAKRGTQDPTNDRDWRDARNLQAESATLREQAHNLRMEAKALGAQNDRAGVQAKFAEARRKLAEALDKLTSARVKQPTPPSPAPGTRPSADDHARQAEAEVMRAQDSVIRAAARAVDATETAIRALDPAQRASVRNVYPPRVTAAALSRISQLTAESTSAPARSYEGLVTPDQWRPGQWARARAQAPVTTISPRPNESGVVRGFGGEPARTAVPARRTAPTDPDAISVPGNPPDAPRHLLRTDFYTYANGTGFEVRLVPIPEEYQKPGGPTHIAEALVRIRFRGTAGDLDAVNTRLNELLNGKRRATNTDGTPGAQLHFTVEDADAPGVTGRIHQEVTWLPTVDGEVPRSSRSRWAVDADPEILVHELLHMYGLLDEYPEPDAESDPGVFRTRRDQSRVDLSLANIMVGTETPYVDLRQHQIDQISDLIRPALERGNGGPTPYEPPVRIADLSRA
ncbi:hypothetical protein DEF23_24520, partial [Marinitenerispora sediminis]